jgi:dGTPase
MYRTREKLEQLEDQALAPYALRSRDTKGRFHPESEPEYRTAFQRDRDRVVHSAAFRRLEYKTQVFVNDAGDYYRTRLTHTLEVAQIGRTLARGLGINEDLVEVICLAHDLGHAPFGHAGEHALDKLMKENGGGNFNHNHQSYRVVTEIETRYPHWRGLNLSIETLEGIAKHETEYDLSEATGFNIETRGSLEAQIANIADELAYNAHDLDDGIQSGLIVLEQLQDLEIWRLLCDRLNWSNGQMDVVTRHRFIREQIGLQVDDVLAQTIHNMKVGNIVTWQDVQNHHDNLVQHSADFVRMNRELKDFLYKNMYHHYTVMRMSQRAERIINELFQTYMDEPRQLPDDYQALAKTIPLSRVVADYIACLTDRSAQLEYRRMFASLT